MKLLLDTHVFLWWCLDDAHLSEDAKAAIAEGENEIFLSTASVWEIVIKVGLGKLDLPDPPGKFIPARLKQHSFQPLGVLMEHALAISRLEDFHRDLFDRLLVAQSLVEGFPLITGDPLMRKYPIKIIW